MTVVNELKRYLMLVQRKFDTDNHYNNQSFKAIRLAKYSGSHKNGLCIYQLEKSDLSLINRFQRRLNDYFSQKNITSQSRREIITNSIDTIKKVFESNSIHAKKTKILVAVDGNELCGIIVGNIPKQSPNGKIYYTSRKNHSKKETELDWLVTWNPFKDKKVKGVGKCLGAEYFRTLKKDNFNKVFVRSELPEISIAQSFYEHHLGFSVVPAQRECISKQTNNKLITGEYYKGNDEIIPMLAKSSNIQSSINNISKQYNRQDYLRSNMSLDFIVKD